MKSSISVGGIGYWYINNRTSAAVNLQIPLNKWELCKHEREDQELMLQESPSSAKILVNASDKVLFIKSLAALFVIFYFNVLHWNTSKINKRSTGTTISWWLATKLHRPHAYADRLCTFKISRRSGIYPIWNLFQKHHNWTDIISWNI